MALAFRRARGFNETRPPCNRQDARVTGLHAGEDVLEHVDVGLAAVDARPQSARHAEDRCTAGAITDDLP
jgi:hypothetical protein